jgi:hypothetical protein
VTPVRVVEHRFLARDCPLCQKRWVASAALEVWPKSPL